MVDSSFLLRLSFFFLLPLCEARTIQVVSVSLVDRGCILFTLSPLNLFIKALENESVAPSLWWIAGFIGLLGFSLFGVITIKLYKDAAEETDVDIEIEGARSAMPIATLVSGTGVPSSMLPAVYTESGVKFLKYSLDPIPADSRVADGDRTITLRNGQTYCLFRTSEFPLPPPPPRAIGHDMIPF